MLIDIKAKLGDTNVQDLITLAIYPDPEKVKRAIKSYKSNPALELLGYYDEEELIGLIGFHIQTNNILEIIHIAVSPDEQGHGYGRGIILEVLALKSPSKIIVETDEDSINFYRSIGFSVVSLGEMYPGVERFKCTYEVDEDEDVD